MDWSPPPPLPQGLIRLRSSDGSAQPAGRLRTAQSLASALGGAPVTQEQAKAWFHSEQARPLGHGGMGVTRVLQLPSGVDIVIKKVTTEGYADEAYGDDEEMKMEEWKEADGDMGELFREEAMKEYRAHTEAWTRFAKDGPCPEFLSEPAVMVWPDKDQNAYPPEYPDAEKGSYLVQTFAGVPGLKTMPFLAFSRLLAEPGHATKLRRGDKIQVAHAFGTLLGCLANARMLHVDMNEQNLLVLNNLEDSTEFRFAWRLIDWGSGRAVAAGDAEREVEMCFDTPKPGVESIPGFKLAGQDPACYHENEERYGIVLALYRMFRNDDADPPVDDAERVYPVEVVSWVREGYGAQTRLQVPPSVVAEAEQRLAAERAARA